MTAAETQLFQAYLQHWYKTYGRHILPWRQTTDPYHILVSELMLQQTQVARVIPKYATFIEQFPTVQQLAGARQEVVVKLWQGLGYNRRALYLHHTSKIITGQRGIFPRNEEALRQLPGIGPYTASAIMAFAYNARTVMVETNIRTVFLYHFFAGQADVADVQVRLLVKQTLPTQNYREWYAALMDYGSYLKEVLPNPSRKSKHHAKQSLFATSQRKVRGEVIMLLSKQDEMVIGEIARHITGIKAHLPLALKGLEKDGFISIKGETVTLKKA